MGDEKAFYYRGGYLIPIICFSNPREGIIAMSMHYFNTDPKHIVENLTLNLDTEYQ